MFWEELYLLIALLFGIVHEYKPSMPYFWLMKGFHRHHFTLFLQLPCELRYNYLHFVAGENEAQRGK